MSFFLLTLTLAGTAQADAPSDAMAFGDQGDCDELIILVDGETFRMKRVVSASGAKYEAEDDPTTVFWSKGQTAFLTVRGEEHAQYVLIRNSRNEDELFLSVDGENFRLHLVRTASGAKYEALDDPSTYFWSKGDTATLFIRGKEHVGYDASPGTDAPSDDADIPLGVEWTVRSIAGEPLVPGSVVTVRFDHNGRLGGRASVNTYRSGWIAIGDRLLIHLTASTRMAAPQNLMDQEEKFIAMLEDVRTYKIRSDTLILTTKHGTKIVATR